MLTRVEIKNYRGFESYEMQDLTQVNLLVGKNNSGKTALLEGIQFLASGGDPAVLDEAAKRRGEVILRKVGPSNYADRVLVDIIHFFHGHTFENDVLSFSGNNGYPSIAIQTFTQEASRANLFDEERSETANAVRFFLKITDGLTSGDSQRDESKFAISEDGGVNFGNSISRRRPGSVSVRRSSQVCFVGPDSLTSNDLAVMWDEITVSGKEADVADAMRLLEEDLTSVHPLTGVFSQSFYLAHGGFVVGIKGQEERIPLGSMGDGIRRLMALAASLAFTKAGSLFVDEIDTGLHYSVMSDMWKMIVAKAVASNTQVFATTHSWDCIEGLALLCQREPEWMSKVAIHKVDPAIPHSIPFSGESIVRMAKADIDPR